MTFMFELINSIFVNFIQKFVNFLPNLFVGLLILLIGIVFAEILRKVFVSLIRFFKLEILLHKAGLASKTELDIWKDVLAELLRWTLIILFLLPTVEVWGLSRVTVVINQLLFYLPNVIVAVIIGFIGLVVANLGADLVKHGLKTLNSSVANTLSVFTKSIIIFFTVLIVLNQLGVAQDLIRILFTGIVAMLALAGGLAFGLGGREMAGELLNELKNKLK